MQTTFELWLLQHRSLAPSILHYFQAPPILNFKVMCCACDSNVSSFEDLEQFIEDLSFFFEIKQRLKRMTYSIDKEETSIIILKSFSCKVISTDMLVYICMYIYIYIYIYNCITIIIIIIKTNMLAQFYYFICFVHIN